MRRRRNQRTAARALEAALGRPRILRAAVVFTAALSATLVFGCVGTISDGAPGSGSEPGDDGGDRPGRRPGDPPTTPLPSVDELTIYSRLTKLEYRYVVEDLLEGAPRARVADALDQVDSFNENNYSGFYKNYDPIGVYPGLEITQLGLARALATAFPEAQLHRVLCAADCAESIVDELVPRIWKRRLPSAERAALINLYASFPAATRDYYFLMRIFASPYFHYKIFAASPTDADEANIKKAQLLSFAISGSFPDEGLQRDVDTGAVDTPGRWQHHVARLLDEHALRFSTLFVPQWLGMASSYESHDAYHGVPLATVMSEPARIFAVALGDGLPISALIALDFNVVDGDLAALYGATPAAGGGWQRRPITPTLFGTAAMSYLTVDHESNNPSPIRRGSYIVNHLLCKHIVFPPAEIQAEIDSVVRSAPEGLSPPERMAYFRSRPTCAGCHNQFDPYGLALEQIGALGATRDVYYTGDPIVAEGTAGDIVYSSSVDFANQLADTATLNTCFASQVFSYLSSSPHVDAHDALSEFDDELLTMNTRDIVAAMVLRALGEEE